jgi:hypothetical protein
MVPGKGVHEEGECGCPHLRFLSCVLVDWQQHLLDLPLPLGAQTAEGIDGLDTDDTLFPPIRDDLFQSPCARVNASISECRKGQHLLIGGFRLLELRENGLKGVENIFSLKHKEF